MAKLSTSTNIDWVQVQEQGSAPATPASGYGRIYCKADGLYFVGDGGVEVGPLAAATAGGFTQGARVYNSGALAISSGGQAALTFDSERYDTNAFHNTSSNTSRLTIPTGQAGKYLIVGNIRWASSAAGLERVVMIKLNNTTLLAEQWNNAASASMGMTIFTIYSLAEADYVELVVYQDSGGNLNVEASAARSPEFMLQRIG